MKNDTYLQYESPRNVDEQSPSFLQGLGEHDMNPENEEKNKRLFNCS